MPKFIKTIVVFIFTVILLSPVIFAGSVPDTGQTRCYDDAGNYIPCPKPGEPFFGQDANYITNPQSYTKLDGQGNALPDSAASWVMVKDNVTGLVWEVKTNDGSIHDVNKTYSWPAQSFIDALNTAKFGGYSNWRLPTIKELTQIVNRGKVYPAIDIEYFGATSNSTYGYWPYGLYWSSTTYLNNWKAWYVNFNYGDLNYGDQNYSLYVRAVRSGQ